MGLKPDFVFGAIAGKDNETFLQQAKAAGSSNGWYTLVYSCR